MKIETVAISVLQKDPENARKHSKKNIDAIAGSLKKFGQRRPLVVWQQFVIAGNGTLDAAQQIGWTEIEITRVPEDWTHEEARAYAIADNRTSELAEWDDYLLSNQLIELDSVGFDIGEIGFDSLNPFLTTNTDDGLGPYIHSAEIPHYEIVGEKPQIENLLDSTKTKKLQEDIEQAQLPDDIRNFLIAASYRHAIFNYKKIAEFYPHADEKVQKLFRDSVLVIIDLQDALKKGYAVFLNELQELEEVESAGN
jgi:hypothetical protein